MCWAFDTVPSRLPEVFWGNSRADLRAKIELKVGYEHMKALQEFSSFAKVAALALGGGKDDAEEEDRTPANMMAAQMQFAAMFGGR